MTSIWLLCAAFTLPVTNDDAATNVNVCVGERELAYILISVCVGDLDLAYEPPSKRCSTQRSYDVTIIAEIGKYTYSDGQRATVRPFSTYVGHRVPESTARKFGDAYNYTLWRNKITSFFVA